MNDDCFDFLSNYTSGSGADAQTMKAKLDETVIFGSPPWGGPGYRTDDIFDLSTMLPYSLHDIHGACNGMSSVLYLPRTSDLRQLARCVPDGQKVEVVQYCMEGASKALCAFIPAAGSGDDQQA